MVTESYHKETSSRGWLAIAAVALAGIGIGGWRTGIIDFKSPVDEAGAVQSPVAIDVEELKRYLKMITDWDSQEDSIQQPIASRAVLDQILEQLKSGNEFICPQAPNPMFLIQNNVPGAAEVSEPIAVCLNASGASLKNHQLEPDAYWLSLPLQLDPNTAGLIDWDNGIESMDLATCERMIEKLTVFSESYISSLPVPGLSDHYEPIVVTPSENFGNCPQD